MKSEQRFSFAEDVRLKPLFANLCRIGIANYVSGKNFRHLVVEMNLDEEWNDCQSVCHIDSLSEAEDYEDPFWLFINILFEDPGVDVAEGNLSKIVLDFMKYSSYPIDLNGVLSSLKELETSEALRKEIRRAANRINALKQAPSKDLDSKAQNNKVFIIHGHDSTARLELEKLLSKEFKLSPIVLQDTPGDSMETIISKFEREARTCGVAIALFTPDDELISGKFNPRLNVVLELGYFMGRDQGPRRRLIILKKSRVDGPSDIHGVETINFKESISEISYKLLKQLKHWNVVK